MLPPTQQHPLAQLINDYTNNLAFAGLEIEILSDFYLNRKKPLKQTLQPEKNNDSQSSFFQFLTQDFSRWSVKQCEILIEMLKNDLLSKGAQNTYVKVYCNKMKDIQSKTQYNQLKERAIQEFNKMTRNQQIQYLGYYLQEGIKFVNNIEGTQRDSGPFSSYLGQSYKMSNQGQKLIQNGLYFQGINLSFLSGFSPNDLINREYARQSQNLGQYQANKLQGKQETNLQYNQGDSRSKNEIYKLALGNRTNQKPQKQNNKSDQAKQKEEFQTLKSLFKKLQNNA